MVAQEPAQPILVDRAAIAIAGRSWLAGYAGSDGLGYNDAQLISDVPLIVIPA